MILSGIEENMSEGAVLQVNSFIRGYHEYLDVWLPNMDDEYHLKREPGNKMDPNDVAIVRPVPRGRSREEFAPKPNHQNELGDDSQVLGHVPKLMAIWLTKFLKRATNNGKTVVKGKRLNRGGGYGLEVPCEYHFMGDKMSIEWLASKLKKEGFDFTLS